MIQNVAYLSGLGPPSAVLEALELLEWKGTVGGFRGGGPTLLNITTDQFERL